MTHALLLFQTTVDDLTGVPWSQLQTAIGAVVVLFLILLFFLRVIPTIVSAWKEIRLAEVNVREKEAEADRQQAASTGQLSEVLNNIAVKHQYAIDKVLLLQRVNADSSEHANEKFDLVIEHIDNLTNRVESIEKVIKRTKEYGPQAKNATPTA
jgi:hypothetical protein